MKERIEVNLLPAEYRFHFKHFDLKREIIYPFLLLILTIVIFGWWTIWLTAQIGYYEKKIAEVDISIHHPI